MKKQLLTAALMLTGIIAFTPTTNAKSSMDAALSLVWMNTDVSPISPDARQGFGMNDNFYLQNKATQKIEVWNGTGKVKEIDSGGGTNITRDDAGNIIVRLGTFNTDYVKTRNEMRIISADGTRTVDIPLSGITAGRLDFWGNVKGNVLDKTTGGVLYMGTNWHGFITEIPIIDGVQDVANTYQYAYANPLKTAGTFTTTSLVSGWDGIEDLTILSPFNGATGTKTTGNSIQRMALDQDGNWIIDSYFITPRHNGCTGYSIFKLGNQKFIVYSTGSNDADGFSISLLKTKTDPTVEDTDETYRIATKYAETNADGNVTYKNNTFYGNHFSVDAVDDNTAYIYQYFPAGYIAKYNFDLTKSGIANVEAKAPTAKVIGRVGEIAVEGEASSINVYTLNGALISSNKATIECPAGLYIVNVDGNATKVLVK